MGTKHILSGALAALAFLAVMIGAPSPVWADCQCEDEAERLCRDVEPGEGRVWTCLLNHESELGWACKRHLNRQGAVRQKPLKPAVVSEEVQKVCKSDRKRYCKYVDWEDGRVTRCLRIHEQQISGKCRAALEP